MSEKNRARQEAFTKRRQAEGLKRFQFWATPEEKEFLKNKLAEFRDNGGDSGLPCKRTNEKPVIGDFQTELLKGEFPVKMPRYPRYTIDKPWDNLRYWNNMLPKGIIVFSDAHKRKKRRAVELAGLGAFPVLWAIRYALEQRCWELAPPRTRRINFTKFDVQQETIRIVQTAKLRVDADYLNSSLGFLLHPIAAKAITVDQSVADQPPDGVLVVVIDEFGKLVAGNVECPGKEDILQWMHGHPGFSPDRLRGTWHPAMVVLTRAFIL